MAGVIAGYWAYFPQHGSEHARRFENLEQAKAYFGQKINAKHGRSLPLGPRVIIRVSWCYARNEWTYDKIEHLTQEEVDELFFEHAAKVAEAS